MEILTLTTAWGLRNLLRKIMWCIHVVWVDLAVRLLCHLLTRLISLIHIVFVCHYHLKRNFLYVLSSFMVNLHLIFSFDIRLELLLSLILHFSSSVFYSYLSVVFSGFWDPLFVSCLIGSCSLWLWYKDALPTSTPFNPQ